LFLDLLGPITLVKMSYISVRNVSKSEDIEELATEHTDITAHHQINTDEIIIVGDGKADIEMIDTENKNSNIPPQSIENIDSALQYDISDTDENTE